MSRVFGVLETGTFIQLLGGKKVQQQQNGTKAILLLLESLGLLQPTALILVFHA